MNFDYVSQVVHTMSEQANPSEAVQMKKYMRNKYEFLGIKAPELRKLARPFLSKTNLPSIEQMPDIIFQLWQQPQREYQYFVIEALKKYLKNTPEEWIELYERLIIQKSWWDTVDALAAWSVGHYFKLYPGKIPVYTTKWIQSDNLWLQRTCLIYQLKYKHDTDFELMKSFIVALLDSKEFFIQKAIGWALREYSKIKPGLVYNLRIVNHYQN